MSDDERNLTRRDFLRRAASAVAAAAVGLPVASCRAAREEARLAQAPATPAQAEAPARASVVLVRDEAAVGEGNAINFDVVGRMLDDAVTALLGTQDAASAWAQLVKAEDLVGIKSNEWGNLRTPPEVEQILRARVLAAGVPADRVRVTDRQARQMLADCTALINCRPARAHHWAGMGGCIKNYIVFSDNPSQYHPDACDTLATVWDLFGVKKKTRLNILLLLTPQFYARGPHNFDAQYLWPYRGILVSQDPVAVDALGAHLLRTKREAHFGEEQPITPTTHIASAETRYGLGVADLTRIDLTRLGWEAEALI